MQNSLLELSKSVHSKCVVCGCRNGKGLHLTFDVTEEQSVIAVFQCDETFVGYPGILHGGVVTSILDGALYVCPG